jgi:large subunit ribosomal protein L13
MGKTRPSFAPSVDNGDFVVVTDVEALAVTGRKATDKVYRFHTGYFGGLNEIPFATMLAKRPDDILRLAVQRMLPKTIIGRHMIARLKIYKGSAHPHQGQHPVALPGN